MIKRNQSRELTKLIQMTLIGWIVAEIFGLGNTPKLLTGPSQHLFVIFFCEIIIPQLSEDLPDPLDSSVILNQFLELFSTV